jgi:DNA-nicking Smr family endonuclease
VAQRKPRKSSTPVVYDFAVAEELDLHGMAVDEAMVAAEQLFKRHKPGAIVRLVHGHSNAAPDSIRKSLHRMLATAWKRKVKRYRLDFQNPGATLVELSG